ncbi:MAG: hypothetical protein KGI60_04915 [Patescibacteria group bacterium]|nr:hypothetical protein [Patescibacteria group bacterium]
MILTRSKAVGMTLVTVVLLAAACGVAWWLVHSQETRQAAIFDPLNTTYLIDGSAVALVNGQAEQATAPDSASKLVTRVFGVPVYGDLNGDGLLDSAMMVTRDGGGSGTFFYVVAAIRTFDGAHGTDAFLLGDRIAPQNISIRGGQILVNYAVRNPGEPMTTQPSLGVSTYLSLVDDKLQEAAPVAGAGERCGGNMRNAPVCITGYKCAPDSGSHLPFGDVGGTCVAQ